MYNLRFDFKGGRRLSRLFDVCQDTGSIAIFICSIIIEFYQVGVTIRVPRHSRFIIIIKIFSETNTYDLGINRRTVV